MIPNIEEIEDKERRLGFASLSSEERIVFVIAAADFEINLGGAWGYLHNSSGNYLHELVTALGAIGTTETALAGQQLLNKLSGYCCVENGEERVLVLQKYQIEFGDLIDEFSDKFQNHVDDWGDKFHAYFR